MRTIVNIPYLTSGRQITHKTEKNEKNEQNEQNEPSYHNELEQKILERKQKFLKLSDGFREAFNYKTFPEKI